MGKKRRVEAPAFFARLPGFVKTILPRRGGNVLVSEATGGFAFGGRADNFTECVLSRLLSDVERDIPGLPELPRLPRVETDNLPTC
jgi:hypothetical protein